MIPTTDASIKIFNNSDLKILENLVNAEIEKKYQDGFRIVSTSTQFFNTKEEFVLMCVFTKSAQTLRP